MCVDKKDEIRIILINVCFFRFRIKLLFFRNNITDIISVFVNILVKKLRYVDSYMYSQ